MTARRAPHEPRSGVPSVGPTEDGRVRFRWPDGRSETLGLVVACQFHERLGEVLWDMPVVPAEPRKRGAP